MATLFLQGPLGSFFQALATQLADRGHSVYKINFNGGDEWYFPNRQHHANIHAVGFTLASEAWADYLSTFIKEHSIRHILVYGDCRFYHRVAKTICDAQGVQFFAFEEGYLRPNYVTLELDGVNGHSAIRYTDILSYKPVHIAAGEVEIGSNFRQRIRFASVYYIAGLLRSFRYQRYVHHRSFNPFYEAACWVRSGLRKWLYKVTEVRKLGSIVKQPFFFVPLQVHNDAQIQFHSPYDTIEDFIDEVMRSYADSGVPAKLVFKHHPMDRGHCHYGRFIRSLASELGIEDRVQYVHDLHVPSLLKYCEGVVTINSTTALQAFYHAAPVKVMGDAFFDKPRLTDHQSLDQFWRSPLPVDTEFADRFRAYLLDHGQINGSFYSKTEFTLQAMTPHLETLMASSSSERDHSQSA